MAVRHWSKMKEWVMLELLLYCHLFAKLRFAGEIAALTAAAVELVERTETACARWLARAGYGGRPSVPALVCWAERDMAQALDRLGVYVASGA